MSQTTMVHMKPGQSGVVVDIAGGAHLKERLEALGIRPGKPITKVSSVFQHGPVTVRVDQFHLALGFGAASRVIVEVEDSCE